MRSGQIKLSQEKKMFYSLTGKLIMLSRERAVISCGGVGFDCRITETTYRELVGSNEDVTLFTHLNVREDALDLFGFYDREELELFKLLTAISGIGPKAGISILSALSPQRLTVAVMSGDYKAISAAQGVGAKIAQRVVMELKDKLGRSDISLSDDVKSAGAVSASENAADAVVALEALGFQRSEASLAVGKLDSGLDTETLIKQALKLLSKGK